MHDPSNSNSFAIQRGGGETSLLILCDHAMNLLPREYGTLGLATDQMQRHVAYDIGALPVALALGKRLNATVIFSRVSRLLIDPNRGIDDPTLIMQLSDGAVVPGNVALDATEVEKRITLFHTPYHDAIRSEIDAMLSRGITPVIFALHSYTPVLQGVPRPWQGAVLWDKDPRLPRVLMAQLKARTDFDIGDNQPYSGHLPGNCIDVHGTRRGLAHVLFEIRQDLISDSAGQEKWAVLLADCLSAIFADRDNVDSLSRVDDGSGCTDSAL